MRRQPTFVVLVVLVQFFLLSCSKSTDNCSSEPTLTVATTPAIGTTELPSVGPFNLKVSITSTIPSSGVTIDVKAREEAKTTPFFSQSKSSSTKDNNFEIANTPSTVTCIVEITVTSKSCSSKTWSGSYRYSKKG
jgi:hypothetical protein